MTGAGVARVRRARVADLPGVAQLAAEHGAHERAAPPPTDLARRLEILLFGQVQWQTPPWNTDAIRFYDRLGAQNKSWSVGVRVRSLIQIIEARRWRAAR